MNDRVLAKDLTELPQSLIVLDSIYISRSVSSGH